VLVLERASLPRYKPCGGGVSPQIAQWFDFDFSPAISFKTSRVRYTWNMADAVDVELEIGEPIWMVRRDQFDHFLIKQGQSLGAELKDNTSVKGIEFASDRWLVKTAHEVFAGTYVVAADGATGSMAKWLGFRDRKQKLGGALEAEASRTIPDGEPIHFEFGMVKNGYIWNFPKADGYSIGVGTFRGGNRQDFKAILADYGQLFNVDLKTCQQYGHPLCLWDGPQQLHTQNALLAGEAACVVDPFTAEGIRPSIFSGVQAAAAIDAAIGGDLDALERYTQVINDDWGSDMSWAKRLAGLFYRMPGVGYRLGIQRESATRRMGQILCGELRYADVAHRAIQRLSAGLISGIS
jgi:geranylgeranyl reductase family protein